MYRARLQRGIMKQSNYKESKGYKDSKGEGVFTRVYDNEIEGDGPRCEHCKELLDKCTYSCPECEKVKE